MRRLRSDAVRRLVGGACVLLGASGRVHAQSSRGSEGGLEFLLPSGARALGMGQAVAAAATGSDALIWNPALAANGPRELALHLTHGASPIAETDASGAFVYPVRRVGAFALSFRYLNEGTQSAASDANGQVGSFSTTSTIIAATFAPILTSRLSGGITYKLLRFQFNCTGSCDNPENRPQAPAVDLGAAYRLTADSSITIGASVRNLGAKLQFKDAPQADPLPGRADLGVAYSPRLSQLPQQARLVLAADALTYLKGGAEAGGSSHGFRIGGELSWQDRYQARAGYVASGPTGSGPSFGFGIRTGKLQIDLAQFLSDLSQTGTTPTFVSLRYIF